MIHGPVGTGKTHLLEGVYGGLRRARPDWRVCYVTAEDFTNRFVQAMRLGKLAAFRKQYRECDVLLVDDLHFLATKKATQEEFLHTFDALLAVTRAAAEEHEEAADEPEALIEAQAYLASARALADRLAEDAAVAEAGAAAAQALSEAETQLAESPEDTTILPAAAARVELAGLQVP